jgi:putative colanic acid biosysnthesis UDP-glucose lipid carrier transferase
MSQAESQPEPMKRFGEVLVASGVLVFTLPLLAVVGLAIKCESPGPMLEREERLGADGRCFALLRFRCTRVCGLYPSRAVITRTGRFLRYTRIADLPRFVNVLRGEVALIDNGLRRRKHLA